MFKKVAHRPDLPHEVERRHAKADVPRSVATLISQVDPVH
jgi:hypothetical protein